MSCKKNFIFKIRHFETRFEKFLVIQYQYSVLFWKRLMKKLRFLEGSALDAKKKAFLQDILSPFISWWNSSFQCPTVLEIFWTISWLKFDFRQFLGKISGKNLNLVSIRLLTFWQQNQPFLTETNKIQVFQNYRIIR